MKVSIQEKQCKNCSHFVENKYMYYTHDNRMVECYLYKCNKQVTTVLPVQEASCLVWENKRRF